MTNSRATKGVFKTIVKSADESKTTDTTAALDTELKALLPIGEYSIVFDIFLNVHADADLKAGIGSSGGTAAGSISNGTLGAGNPTGRTALNGTYTITTSSADQIVIHRAEIQVTAASTIGYSWAQVTSDANAAIIQEGSRMTIYKS